MSIAWIEPEWPAPASVRALSTQRSDGVSVARYASLNLGDHVGDEPAAVAENRRRLRAAAALPAAPSWLHQVHGSTVVDLDAGPATGPADAAITRQAGRVCALLTADCLPILLASDSGAVIGAAHAGWRGLAAGVIGATLQAMAVPAARLLAWVGPGIDARHYEVGPEVRDAFLRLDPASARAFAPRSQGRYLADLPLIARRQLAALGVSRVYASAASTYGEPEKYFSHRRDGITGRQATLIWLKEPV